MFPKFIEKSFALNSVLLFDFSTNKIKYSENIRKSHTPASTLKLLTSLVAIETLGMNYKFHTEIYKDKHQNIYIKGYGDPLLISDEISKLSKKIFLKFKDSRWINNVYIDQSFFSPASININGTIQSSTEPYDAPNNALAANFNSIYFKKNKNKIISCENETPFIQETIPLIISSNMNKGRIPLDSPLNLLYPGYMIKYFLGKKGIEIKGQVKLKKVDLTESEKIINFTSSFTLEEIIKKMLFYSNNFIANQLFLTCGAIVYKAPANIEKSQKVFRHFIREKKIYASIYEGSGISRKNRITAINMLKIMKLFRQYSFLLKKKENLYYKTGTLSDIKNVVGYFKDKKNNLYSFIIFKSDNNIEKSIIKLKKLTGSD